ncbi:MAG: transport protein RbsD/FucU, partial [Propionibacteriaceae bacterium]|nr:transport protein RbsD/FucU [Propionibacteriaceae bacterium]MCC6498403.1 transport protein RbsD/FucU [Propionibacteriaceae bacterium]
ASKLARKHLIDMPGLTSPRVLQAIRSVMVPDTFPALDLMESPDGVLPVQTELVAAAGLELEEARMVERFAFYDLAAQAELIIRTGETRVYGNALFRKGVTPVMSA